MTITEWTVLLQKNEYVC